VADADGALLPADEWFVHQIVETQAYVGDADRSWTEKVCAMAGTRDGSLSLGLGVGKYPNRNVFDGYAAVSRGREQWTVRASRRLAEDPASLNVGPIRYDVVEPLRHVRFTCDPNDHAPIAFDWTFTSVVPPVLEARDRTRTRSAYRLESDLLRYHQTGLPTGWVEIEGERTEIRADDWFSTRDHSWGIRHDVGLPPSDVEPTVGLMPGVAFRFSWSPMLLRRPNGDYYAMHHQLREIKAFGHEERRFEGTIEHPDGRVERVRDIRADLSYDVTNRRVIGGTLHFVMADGSDRPVTVTALGDTGVHLGLGLYFGLDGHHHGEWRGKLFTEGEYVADCTDRRAAERIHQIRDALMRVEDPIGDGVGWCNLQTAVVGAWPELGLDDDSSFI
jgi:hypothetical protein